MQARTPKRSWTSKARLGAMAATLLGWLSAGQGCTSRTVPLPPPVVESLSLPDEDGLVRVRGRCHEGASVGVMNEATQEGVVVTSPEIDCESSCPFEAYVRAEVGDTIRVWQFFETESSRHVEISGSRE